MFSLMLAAALAAQPIVIAHRGASGERPEHTLAAYALAIEQGADFIEPDLVITRDGVLVARHENEISETTDVADRREFAARKTTKTIDGRQAMGWFTEDFTLAELKTLRAKERLQLLRPANTKFDGRYDVPTFQEVIDLARDKGRTAGRTIGLYPETKHPTYFRSIGLPLEEPLLVALEKNGLTAKDAPVFIQSFEVENLKTLRGQTAVRLVQLMATDGGPYGSKTTYAEMATAAGLKDIALYADGIGPEKTMIIPKGATQPTALVADAHAAGLVVHPWTFRHENYFLPADLRKGISPRAHGDAAPEYRRFLATGIDGLFSDFPGAAVSARDALASD